MSKQNATINARFLHCHCRIPAWLLVAIDIVVAPLDVIREDSLRESIEFRL
jgi:hypothetical protein